MKWSGEIISRLSFDAVLGWWKWKFIQINIQFSSCDSPLHTRTHVLAYYQFIYSPNGICIYTLVQFSYLIWLYLFSFFHSINCPIDRCCCYCYCCGCDSYVQFLVRANICSHSLSRSPSETTKKSNTTQQKIIFNSRRIGREQNTTRRQRWQSNTSERRRYTKCFMYASSVYKNIKFLFFFCFLCICERLDHDRREYRETTTMKWNEMKKYLFFLSLVCQHIQHTNEKYWPVCLSVWEYLILHQTRTHTHTKYGNTEVIFV